MKFTNQNAIKHAAYGVIFALLATGSSLYGYNVTVIPDLGGGAASVSAAAINNNGAVVGNSKTANNRTHAFFYSSDIFMDIGTLGGTNSYATALNDNGDIVGYADLTNGQSHAFYYHNGQMVDLTPGTNFSSSQALGINNSNVIIGGAVSNGVYRPFFYQNGQITMPDLGTRAGAGFVSINDTGEIIGNYSSGQYTYSFKGSIAGGFSDLTPYGASGPEDELVFDINNSSQIVGYSTWGPPDPMYAIWYNGTTIVPYKYINPTYTNTTWLLTSYFHPIKINDNNQMIGSGNVPNQAILYDPISGYTTNSQAGGWAIQSFGGINNAGQIIAVGTNMTGTSALILSPFPYGLVLPTLTSQPQDMTLGIGGFAAFKVVVDPSAGTNLQYQWYDNQTLRTGATNSALYLTNVQTSDVGDYYVSVTNLRGSTNSQPVTLSVDSIQKSTSPNQVDLLLYGQFGYTYQILSCSNLIGANWNIETNFNLSMRPFKWSQSTTSTITGKYFKILKVP